MCPLARATRSAGWDLNIESVGCFFFYLLLPFFFFFSPFFLLVFFSVLFDLP